MFARLPEHALRVQRGNRRLENDDAVGFLHEVAFHDPANKSIPGARVVACLTLKGRFQPGEAALCFTAPAFISKALSSNGTLISTSSACVERHAAPLRSSTKVEGNVIPATSFQLSKYILCRTSPQKYQKS